MTFDAGRRAGRSIPEIVTDLFGQFTTLLSQEALLARTELSEKTSQAGNAIALMVASAVLLIPALVILLGAAVEALETTGLDRIYCALIVGGGVLIIGLILLLIGVNRLKPKNLMPNRTLQQIQRDAQIARQQVSSTNDIQRAA
jgi:uncharacterized membrane protein YqgA involved in biofilm formation